MYNLGTVIAFEFLRTIKKKTFWISILAFPLILIVVFVVSDFSNKIADKAQTQASQQHYSLAVEDDSDLVSAAILKAAGAQLISQKQEGVTKVQSGELDAFFYYPANPAQQAVEVYGKDINLTDNSRYTSLASSLLKTSVAAEIHSPQKVAIVQGSFSTTLKTYKDGKALAGYERAIVPGAFLVLFYLVIVLMGNQMLASTTEEKENRVIEMILTSVESRTLIIGKIISLILLGFVQILVTTLPLFIAMRFFGNQLHLPSIDLSHLVFNPTQILIGSLVFICSFLLFTGILVAIGAAVPTAKEASSFFGIAIFAMIVPVYAVSAIITNPGQLIVRFFSFFPMTAPITLMLRNAAGNLGSGEAVVGISILLISSLVALKVAIQVFQYGTLEYSRKLTFREVFGGK